MTEEKKIEWTKEQNEIIEKMLKETELIGYVQGRDELLKEILHELNRKFLRGEELAEEEI